MKLKWVHLHQAAFIGGVNLGDKLDTSKRTGMELDYSPETQLLTVKYNGAIGLITFPSIFTMVEADAAAAKVKQVK